MAFVLARRLSLRGRTKGVGGAGGGSKTLHEKGGGDAGMEERDAEDSDEGAPGDQLDPPPPGWRKKANLRMYTILDKIF